MYGYIVDINLEYKKNSDSVKFICKHLKSNFLFT